ncbi:hydrolase [Streptomyces fructofermentans]|uniref:hydrolase n=1 Tax=Streptomyces fructofermentans TaxID=152141 RepID=UPI0037903240
MDRERSPGDHARGAARQGAYAGGAEAEAGAGVREPGGGADRVTERLPAEFWATPYVGRRYPGSRSVAERPGLAEGANCQLFAYAVLAHFGLHVPAWRSSDLWADTERSVRVRTPEPLDLALFNRADDAWGAHVGVVAGEGLVLHLCAEVGRPAVWPPGAFAARERYRTLLGHKRLRAS